MGSYLGSVCKQIYRGKDRFCPFFLVVVSYILVGEEDKKGREKVRENITEIFLYCEEPKA